MPQPSGASTALQAPEPVPAPEQVTEQVAEVDVLVEDVSIDGMCGVY